MAVTSVPADLIEALLDFLAQPGANDQAFNDMALRLFQHQFAHNHAYARLCLQRARTPATVRHWHDIPAVPVDGFKALVLSSIEPDRCERIFMTSGTTRPELRGRHYHPDLRVYDRSMLTHFAACVPSLSLPMGILFPDETEMPHSSLAHYLCLAVHTHGTHAHSRHFWNHTGLQESAFIEWAQQAESAGQPVAVLGASYAFVHLLDALAVQGRQLALPPGSWVLDTGGFKGRSREVEPDAFYTLLSTHLGVPRERCLNMYGMTELSSQFYDAGNAQLPSTKRAPHWMRTRAIDPLTGRSVADGQPGILVHTDLANYNSVTTIQTEDVGVIVPGGFQLLGRAAGAEAKGCSLSIGA